MSFPQVSWDHLKLLESRSWGYSPSEPTMRTPWALAKSPLRQQWQTKAAWFLPGRSQKMLLPCLKHFLPKLPSISYQSYPCRLGVVGFTLHFVVWQINLLFPLKLLLETYYSTDLYVLYQHFFFTATSSNQAADTFAVILGLNLCDFKPTAILLSQFYLISNLTNLKSKGG